MIGQPGSVHVATVTVRNPTGFDQTYEFDFYLYKEGTRYAITDLKTVAVESGAEAQVTFNCTFPEEIGEYWVYLDVSVASTQVANYIGTEIVQVSYAGPDIQMSEFSVSPEEIAIGGTVIGSVKLTNVGDATGQYVINWRISPPDTLLATTAGSIYAGQSVVKTYSVVVTEPGVYTLSVNGFSGMVTVGFAPEDFLYEWGSYSYPDEPASNWNMFVAEFDITNVGSIAQTRDVYIAHEGEGYLYRPRFVATVTLQPGATRHFNYNSIYAADPWHMSSHARYRVWLEDNFGGISSVLTFWTDY